jgi:hypothetical protein
MKRFVNAVGSALFAVVVLGCGLGSVLGQTVEPASASEATRPKAVRRVPAARIIRDETGSAVYAIFANESWRRTEVEVKRGQKIAILAGGIIRWAADGIERIDVGPDGTRPPYRDGWNYNHFPFPEAGIGSLLMRIGNGIYPVGASAMIDVEDSGFVEFMINDDRLDDNSGQFEVKVSLLRPE